MQAEICTFGRKGTSNPVEQVHAKQIPERDQGPLDLLFAWFDKVRGGEDKILKASDALKGNKKVLMGVLNVHA